MPPKIFKMPPQKILLSILLLLISNVRLLQGMEEVGDSSRAEKKSRHSDSSLQHNSEQKKVTAAQHERRDSIASSTLSVSSADKKEDGGESSNHEARKSAGPSDADFDALTIEDLQFIWRQLQEEDPDNAISLTEPFLIFHEGEGLTLLLHSFDEDSISQNKALFRNITRLLLERHPQFNVSRFLATCFCNEEMALQNLSEGRAPFNKLILKAIVETAARPDPGPDGFYDSSGLWCPWASLPPATLFPSDISSRSFHLYSPIDSAHKSSLPETFITDQEDNISNLTPERFTSYQASAEIPIATIVHRHQLHAALKERFSALKETASSPMAAKKETLTMATREDPIKTAPAVSLPLSSPLTSAEKVLRKQAKRARQEQAQQDLNDREVTKKTLEEVITKVEKRPFFPSTITRITPTVEHHPSAATTSPRADVGERASFLSPLPQPRSTEAVKVLLPEQRSGSSPKKIPPPQAQRKPAKKGNRAQQKKVCRSSTPPTITKDVAEETALERAGTSTSAEIVADGADPAASYWRRCAERTWNHWAFPRILVTGLALPPYIVTMIGYHFLKGIMEPFRVMAGVANNIVRNAFAQQQALLVERRRIEALEQKRRDEEVAEERRRQDVAAAVAERVAFRTNWERSRAERAGTDDELTSWQDAWERVQQERQQDQATALVPHEQERALLGPTFEHQQNRSFQLPRHITTMATRMFLAFLSSYIGTQLVHFFWDKYFGG